MNEKTTQQILECCAAASLYLLPKSSKHIMSHSGICWASEGFEATFQPLFVFPSEFQLFRALLHYRQLLDLDMEKFVLPNVDNITSVC